MALLTQASRERLRGVHPDLVRVVERAAEISPIAFVVTEGVRSLERQRQLYAAKKSRTMRSRHLTGHACDLAAMFDEDGDGDLDLTWKWPRYVAIAQAVKRAAAELAVPVEWGGDWTTFRDGPHFQLPVNRYPAQRAAVA